MLQRSLTKVVHRSITLKVIQSITEASHENSFLKILTKGLLDSIYLMQSEFSLFLYFVEYAFYTTLVESEKSEK